MTQISPSDDLQEEFPREKLKAPFPTNKDKIRSKKKTKMATTTVTILALVFLFLVISTTLAAMWFIKRFQTNTKNKKFQNPLNQTQTESKTPSSIVASERKQLDLVEESKNHILLPSEGLLKTKIHEPDQQMNSSFVTNTTSNEDLTEPRVVKASSNSPTTLNSIHQPQDLKKKMTEDQKMEKKANEKTLPGQHAQYEVEKKTKLEQDQAAIQKLAREAQPKAQLDAKGTALEEKLAKSKEAIDSRKTQYLNDIKRAEELKVKQAAEEEAAKRIKEAEAKEAELKRETMRLKEEAKERAEIEAKALAEKPKKDLLFKLDELLAVLQNAQVHYKTKQVISSWSSMFNSGEPEWKIIEETVFLANLPTAEKVYKRLFSNVADKVQIIPYGYSRITAWDLVMNLITSLAEAEPKARLIMGIFRIKQAMVNSKTSLVELSSIPEVRRFFRLPDPRKHKQIALYTCKVIKALLTRDDASAAVSPISPSTTLEVDDASTSKPQAIWTLTLSGLYMTKLDLPQNDPPAALTTRVKSYFYDERPKLTKMMDLKFDPVGVLSECKALKDLIYGISRVLKSDATQESMPDHLLVTHRLVSPTVNPSLLIKDVYTLQSEKGGEYEVFGYNLANLLYTCFETETCRRTKGSKVSPYDPMVKIVKEIRAETPNSLNFSIRRCQRWVTTMKFLVEGDSDLGDFYFKVLYALALPPTSNEMETINRLKLGRDTTSAEHVKVSGKIG